MAIKATDDGQFIALEEGKGSGQQQQVIQHHDYRSLSCILLATGSLHV